MNPADVTPMVLAWNEAANIERCLKMLRWAARVVVIDSFSSDATLEICAKFPNVEVVQREFDTFAGQANFGLAQVRTPWALSLDADYVPPEDLSEKLTVLDESGIDGFSTPFVYCVFGKPTRASVYPPRTTLYRVAKASYLNDGHAHRVRIQGRVESLGVSLCHDDRKPLGRWFAAQSRYAREEADALEEAGRVHSFPDRLRRCILVAPAAMLLHCLVVRGGILDGWAGWYYALQRACAELMLSLELLDRKIRRP